MMTIGEINSKLKNLSNTYEIQKEQCAQTYEESFFYANDVKGQEAYYTDVTNFLDALKSEISKIQSLINTGLETSFHNTHSSLAGFVSAIPESLTKTLEANILLASQTAYNKCFADFNVNSNSIDKYISLVNRSTNDYHTLDQKVSDRERRKSQKETLKQDTTSIRAEIKKLKAQRDSCLILCDGYLKSIDGLNGKNLLLLNSGLHK
ncbi:MAG: hypothetical protein IJ068_01830 [Bacilli bacterium]|nr:hypothetical protein [Bacilli bacterium]